MLRTCTMELILNQFLALVDLQAVGNAAEVHTPRGPSHFTADTACAELVWDWCLRLESEFNSTAMAASFQFPKLVSGGYAG